jgi:predicted RNA-binding Zn-ribbon protein involved in translation (DUF1610 family)
MLDKHVSFDEQQRLRCPICGEGYGFHQSQYRISNPEYHDDKSVVVSASTLHHVDSTGYRLADSRPRESIEIKFWCENCGVDDVRLQILQHKGETYMNWHQNG